jgi:hypothetical protein
MYMERVYVLGNKNDLSIMIEVLFGLLGRYTINDGGGNV